MITILRDIDVVLLIDKEGIAGPNLIEGTSTTLSTGNRSAHRISHLPAKHSIVGSVKNEHRSVGIDSDAGGIVQ